MSVGSQLRQHNFIRCLDFCQSNSYKIRTHLASIHISMMNTEDEQQSLGDLVSCVSFLLPIYLLGRKFVLVDLQELFMYCGCRHLSIVCNDLHSPTFITSSGSQVSENKYS